jgi:predicted amidohydrolase YtcJ
MIRRGHEAGFQVCVHANGDRTIEMALNGFEKALAALPRKDHRHRLEHCTVINPEILKRIRKTRLLVTPFGSYIYFHGEKMNPHYGPERVARNILKAVERNRAVAPIAAEAWIAYAIKRVSPRLAGWTARRIAAATE